MASSYGEKNKKMLNTMMDFNGLHTRSKIETKFGNFARYGMMDPYGRVGITHEYLFFTKPDCHIFKPGTLELQSELAGNSFFVDAAARYKYSLAMLQKSAKGGGIDPNVTSSPFMVLLSNTVSNTLDLSAVSADTVESSTNNWETVINYRTDTWKEDENISFSLEFLDSRWAETYMVIKAYEEYEKMAHTGYLSPPSIKGDPNAYTVNKELHDTFGVYKFIVDDDFTSIIYWAYICGCYFMNVPRDAFNDIGTDGIKFTVDFKGFCVYDMDPFILTMFNTLVSNSMGAPTASTEIPVYGNYMNGKIDYTIDEALTDSTWPRKPYIIKTKRSKSNNLAVGMNHNYQLRWFK